MQFAQVLHGRRGGRCAHYDVSTQADIMADHTLSHPPHRFTPRSITRICITLALLSVAGCSTPGPGSGTAKAPDNDSMAAECPSSLRYAAVAAPDATLAQIKEITEARLAALNLHAQWKFDNAEPFTDDVNDRVRLQRLLSTILPALERYPASLFAQMKLDHVALVKNLDVAGQRRRAMPSPETSTLVYADNGEIICPAGMEVRVHHEFYHFIDYRLFGDFYYRDPKWTALNPEGITYGSGGSTAYGIPFNNLGHPSSGMVSRYALYGVEEDKAETFGWMMTPNYAHRVQQWSGDDAFLASKRNFMIALFKHESQGAMDDGYFARLAQ